MHYDWCPSGMRRDTEVNTTGEKLHVTWGPRVESRSCKSKTTEPHRQTAEIKRKAGNRVFPRAERQPGPDDTLILD